MTNDEAPTTPEAAEVASDAETFGNDEYDTESAEQLDRTLTRKPMSNRNDCPGCRRPRLTCICSALPKGLPLHTRSRIVLLIHPKEVRRACGTAPLLTLCLSNLVIYEAEKFPEPEEDPKFHATLVEGGRRAYLVCPGPGAEELRRPASVVAAAAEIVERGGEGEPAAGGAEEPEDAAESEADDDGPGRTLIFIDARWKQAKAMVNRSRWLLDNLPRVVLVPEEHSAYGFRKQPAEGCLSTLEAVAESLLVLEGSRGPALKTALVRPFLEMVRLQCGFTPEHQDKNAPRAPRAIGDDGCGGDESSNAATLERAIRQARERAAAKIAAAGDTEADKELAAGEVAEEGQRRSDGGDAADGAGEWRMPERLPDVQCVVRWSERSVSGRFVVVTEVHCEPLDDVKDRATELSKGQSRGKRFWVLPPGKLPEGARYEPLSP